MKPTDREVEKMAKRLHRELDGRKAAFADFEWFMLSPFQKRSWVRVARYVLRLLASERKKLEKESEK